MIYSHTNLHLLIYSRNIYGIYWSPTIALSLTLTPLTGEGRAVSQFLCSEDQFLFSFFLSIAGRYFHEHSRNQFLKKEVKKTQTINTEFLSLDTAGIKLDFIDG